MSLSVTSDLSVSVDGIDGHLHSDGDRLVFRTDDPAHVFRSAFGTTGTGPPVLRFVADRLVESGLSLEFVGPSGTVATIGAGVHSVVGRLASGSASVRLGSPKAVAPVALARVEQSKRALAIAGVGLGAAALLAASIGRRR